MQTKDRVGQQFGNYHLTRLIGKGGYAEVYLAKHVILNDLRAIKVLTGTSLMDYQREEFLDEARTVANLQRLSSHIVQIYDVGIQPTKDEYGANVGIPYLVMEYAPEGTMRTLYPHRTIVPLERIVFYVNQIAEALQCAHDHQPHPIVHRDIKPENMLLRSRDHILLTDFGIAATGQTGPIAMPSKIVSGTVAYIAPERFSHHLRRASDQYSLAIVVYEWLCGYCPFDGTNPEIIYMQLTAQPPPLYPNPKFSHVTPEIEGVVMRALAKKPEDRYPTVREFAQALEAAVQSALLQQQQQQRQAAVNAGQSTQIQQRQAAINAAGQSIGVPSQTQPNPGQRVYAQNINNISTTVPLIAQHTLPLSSIPVPVTIQPFQQQLQKRERVQRTSFEFTWEGKNGFFLTGGIVLNCLAAASIGFSLFLLLGNFYLALNVGVGAGIVVLLMFTLYVCAIERGLSLFFGMLVALCWGGSGWVIGSLINISQSLNRPAISIAAGLLFFSISFGLHILYISRKNL